MPGEPQPQRVRLRWDPATETWDQFRRKLIDTAPPPSSEQAARLAHLLGLTKRTADPTPPRRPRARHATGGRRSGGGDA